MADSLENRRRGSDRRNPVPSTIPHYLFRGSRRAHRRDDDPKWDYHVDRPATETWVIIALVILLSAMDAFLSLQLFERGSLELNPILLITLRWGVVPFLFTKGMLTFFGVFLLLAYWRFVLFRRLIVPWIARFLLAVYCLLVIYELWLFTL